MADQSRSRTLTKNLEQPGYHDEPARERDLTRSNVSNQRSCLPALRSAATAIPDGRQTRYEHSLRHAPRSRTLNDRMSAELAVDETTPSDNPNCAEDACCE